MTMEITRIAKSTIPTLAVESPLRSFDQLAIGSYITAPGFTAVFLIVGIPDNQHVELQKMPLGIIEGDHRHQLKESKGKLIQMCDCGYRLASAKPDEPLGIIQTKGPAAAYVITPPRGASILTPVPGVIYAYALAGAPKFTSIGANGRWTAASTPLFPTLTPVWSLPESWRGKV